MNLKLVDTDLFCDMPQSSRLLYYELLIRADDDGFVSSPKKIATMVGCPGDAIKILLGKKFIISFSSGIIVISHWKQHNYIRSDRYSETLHKNEKKLLVEKDSIYSITSSDIPHDIPLVDSCRPQVRLGKVRLGKVNKKPSFDFEIVWDQYPKKVGRKASQRFFNASVKTKEDFESIKIALSNYKKSKSFNEGYVQNGSTWFNNWKDWVEYVEMDKPNTGFVPVFKKGDDDCQECWGMGYTVAPGSGMRVACREKCFDRILNQ